MNKTKQLYKLFESFRFFLLLLYCMKYSTNIFSLGYLISEILQLNIYNNRISKKAFILVLFPFSRPIFLDKAAIIFQKRVLLTSFSSLFPSACCNLSLTILEIKFIFIFSLFFYIFPIQTSSKRKHAKEKKKLKNHFTLKKKLDNYLVLCCYFLSPFPTLANLAGS